MLKKPAALAGMLAMLVATPVLRAETNGPIERFTFDLAGEAWTDTWGERRLDLVLQDWSGEADRDRMAELIEAGDSAAIATALRTMPAIGHINWPGNLTYSVRYAWRSPQADGGETVVVVADRRAWTWWDTSLTRDDAGDPFTVFQITVDRDGTGVGKASLGGPIASSPDTGVSLAEFDTQPELLRDVRRERS